MAISEYAPERFPIAMYEMITQMSEIMSPIASNAPTITLFASPSCAERRRCEYEI